MFNKMKRVVRRVINGSFTASQHGEFSAIAPKLERLEERTFLSATHATPFKKAAPTQVLAAYMDNRGGALMTTTYSLDINTLSRKTAAIYTAGPNSILGDGDDVRQYTAVGYRKGTLTLRASLAVNTPYRVILNAAVIKDVYGRALDGEFTSQGQPSGDGIAGGNYDVLAQTPKRTNYRFSTVAGYINVAMLTKSTATTVINFKHYADEGAWDTTFFHRSTKDGTSGIQVVQGGGFNVDSTGNIGSVHSHTGIGLQLGNSNLKGTLAMARTSDVNSNTNQWFFNVNDNVSLDTVGGGYTVFGVVMDTKSQAVIEALNNLTIRQGDPSNVNSPFNELPSLDPTGTIDVPNDLALVTRVAMLLDQTKNTGATPFAVRPTVTTLNSTTTPIVPATPFAVTTIAATKNSVLEEQTA